MPVGRRVWWRYNALMPRGPRNAPGGLVYHVLNRGVGRQTLFFKPEDFDAFERIMHQGLERTPLRILSYLLMPNHWHMVLWPHSDGDLTAYLRWVTNTHTQRWRAHYHNGGLGHVYQGRFKSFPVQEDLHLLLVCRYVERNALRANLVPRAQDWRWSSLWRREQAPSGGLLSEWPVDRPSDWTAWVNEPQSATELQALRQSVNRGCPFGAEAWRDSTAAQLGLHATPRPRGRPTKRAASVAH